MRLPTFGPSDADILASVEQYTALVAAGEWEAASTTARRISVWHKERAAAWEADSEQCWRFGVQDRGF